VRDFGHAGRICSNRLPSKRFSVIPDFPREMAQNSPRRVSSSETA
jgi:hypothetical protein